MLVAGTQKRDVYSDVALGAVYKHSNIFKMSLKWSKLSRHHFNNHGFVADYMSFRVSFSSVALEFYFPFGAVNLGRCAQVY